MASPGSGGAQYRRGQHGPLRGKGRFNKDNGSRDRGGGVQAGKRKAEPWKQQGAQRPGKMRRTWKSSQQVIAGSTKEGQGFALWRKQKVQLDYKKLQRKQKKTTAVKDLYADHYPEHLKHLYLAEEERLNNLKRKQKPEEEEEEEEPTQITEEQEEVVVVVVPKKKFKNKTSIQKAKEEYKRVQQERERKRKEAEENRRKREEAKELYKKKKMETYKVLNTKTKKGQPNFNVQMEYLLKKIQSQT